MKIIFKCSGKTPVEKWYSEVSKYNFHSGRDDGLQAGKNTWLTPPDDLKFEILESFSL